MKKLIASIMMFAASLFVASSVTAAEVDMKDPYKMVTAVAEQTFNKLQANKDKIKDVKFRKELVRNDLMPYVDTKYASYKVMGAYAKQASAEERDAFTEAFSEYIVASFADALSLYNDQKLITPDYKTVSDDAKQVNVKFLIRDAKNKDLELVFKVRKNTKSGEWRAFDLVSEGISMLSAKESELNPLIRTRGLKAVTDLIVKHNETGSTEAIK